MFQNNSDLGTAKHNQYSPIHNWYKFTAGFSHKFIDEILKIENLSTNESSKVFDPFAGCGTTLVSCQKNGIKAVGNEGQEFMYDVIRAKLNWDIKKSKLDEYYLTITSQINETFDNYDDNKTHPLLKTLYSENILKEIHILRDSINLINDEVYQLFFKLALSQTLHKVSIHPIAIPYISRTKKLVESKSAIKIFETNVYKMYRDLKDFTGKKQLSDIYLHDSRQPNPKIKTNSCDVCITSPPYLNNLDYGEVSKVHTHFYGITDSWNDITNRVRKQLVTGSTTHYKENEFNLDDFKNSDFYLENTIVAEDLLSQTIEMKKISITRKGKKSFDILTLLYFQDMYSVLKEIRRVLKKGKKAYLVLGDSAPYGIFINTTEILGEIAMSIGFNKYEITKVRTRGTKWAALKNRHHLELSENILILST
jgi:DNA modification methylase